MSDDLVKLEHCNSMVERANQLLAEAHTAQEFNFVIREAEVARVMARQVKLGEAAVNHAQAVKIRAEIRLADVIDAGQADGSIAETGRPPINVRTPDISQEPSPVDNGWARPPADNNWARPPTRLPDLGIDRRRLAEARELRQLAPTTEQAEQRVLAEANRATSEGRELSRTGLIQLAREPRRVEARQAHQHDVEEMREFARSITPDDYDPAEDRHSAAVQQAILAALDGVKYLDRYDAEDIRRGLNHSNPKVRNIVFPTYMAHLKAITEIIDRFRGLLP